MVVTPQMYYEDHIEGKSAVDIRNEITKLNNAIEKLKYKMEDPCALYEYTIETSPDDDMILYFMRLYRKRAIAALNEMNEEYELSQEEKDDLAFKELMPCIKRMELRVNGYSALSHRVMTVTVDGDFIKIDRDWAFDNREMEVVETERVFALLEDLHLGEWREEYLPEIYEIVIMDGISWDLEICFSDNVPSKHIYGSNVYPYNFYEFLEIFGAEDILNDVDDVAFAKNIEN